MIEVGNPAPEFKLHGTTGEISLANFKDRMNVILVFYPLDWTGTWSKEIPDLEANLSLFEKLDTQVLGVSIDTKHSHKNWAESLGGISFPLLSDWHPTSSMEIWKSCKSLSESQTESSIWIETLIAFNINEPTWLK